MDSKVKKTIVSLVIIALAIIIVSGGYSQLKNVSGETDRRFSDMAELFQYWEENGYPDYVGGVYSSGGSTNSLTVLLVNDDRSVENRIRASLVSTYGLSFGAAKYSYNELTAVNDEIAEKYMASGSKVYTSGVGWASPGAGFGASGKEFRVVVTVDESVLTKYKENFNLLYGDMVEVQEGSAVDQLSAPAEEK